MAERITDLARFLARDWTLERRLLLLGCGQEGTVTGNARWGQEPSGDGPSLTARPGDGHSETGSAVELRYEERGTLRLGGHTCEVSRAYRYRFISPVCAEVAFVDGRSFHRLDLGVGEARIEHRCGRDVYRGLVEVASPTEIHQTWTVTGPAKDYTSITVLQARGEH